MTSDSKPSSPSASSPVVGLFDEVADRWHVLWTRPRQEKAVARYLDAAGVEHYLPLVDRVNFARGRKTTTPVPLFPGYVFMSGRREDGFAAIATKRVCQVLAVPDQERFVQEIAHVRTALERGGELERFPFATVGRRCRVTGGPFLGLEGVVTQRLGPTRLVLQIAILTQGAALEIDIDLLEPID